jgi:hypothetical protein
VRTWVVVETFSKIKVTAEGINEHLAAVGNDATEHNRLWSKSMAFTTVLDGDVIAIGTQARLFPRPRVVGSNPAK